MSRLPPSPLRLGDRVRLKTKKRMAYVRRIRWSARGWQVMVSAPLGGFLHWELDELETC